MRIRDLLARTDRDGRAFGIPEDARKFYILAMHPSGSADLYRHDGEDMSDRLAHVPADMWHTVAQAALFDFNFRLADKREEAGTWPEPGGTVRLHPCFGRELEMAMIVGSESFQNAPTMVKAWAELKVDARQALWKRWKAVLDADAANLPCALVRMLHETAARGARVEREHRQRIAGLYRYVVEGDPSGLDLAFGDPRSLGMEAQAWLKRLSPSIYTIDTSEMLLDRMKMRKAAKALAEERRARVAQMAEAA